MTPRQSDHTKLFNYSFVIRNLLPYLLGLLRYHINLINAAAGCEDFTNDRARIIASDGTRYSTYLSDMKKEARNAPEEFRLLFSTGEFNGERYDKPSAERFKKIVQGHLKFRDEQSIIEYREIVYTTLLDPKNTPYMSNAEINALKKSAHNDEIENFIFNCIYTTIMCKGNSALRHVSPAELDAVEAAVLNMVHNILPAEYTALKIIGDEKII